MKTGRNTRERILRAAGGIFARQGFRDTTIGQICRAAGANIAAVNYYYGNKAKLYVEAWRYALRVSLAAHPPDGGVPAGASAEERLRGRILSIMRRIADPKSYAFDIVHKEMANPTGLLTDAMRESLEPLRIDFMRVIGELLGGKATDRQVRLCHMSIMAQCFGPLLRERRRRSSGFAGCSPRDELPFDDIRALADHVAAFSLAGIRDTRRRAKKRC